MTVVAMVVRKSSRNKKRKRKKNSPFWAKDHSRR